MQFSWNWNNECRICIQRTKNYEKLLFSFVPETQPCVKYIWPNINYEKLLKYTTWISCDNCNNISNIWQKVTNNSNFASNLLSLIENCFKMLTYYFNKLISLIIKFVDRKWKLLCNWKCGKCINKHIISLIMFRPNLNVNLCFWKLFSRAFWSFFIFGNKTNLFQMLILNKSVGYYISKELFDIK